VPPEDPGGAPAPLVAVFDLDGTITHHDTLAPYVLGYLLRHPWRLPPALGVIPVCVLFLLGRADQGDVKSVFIRLTLGGLSREALETWTVHFVARLVRTGVYREALQRIRRHAERGDFLVLLSASTDLYVPQIGRALGFAQVVCTGVTWDGNRLVGTLSTPNRRGEEKVRCLARLKEQHPRRLFAAYGNAGSDIPHLRMAERPLLVNGDRAARAEAQRYGIPCARWH
jgi:phosphatidylglycerophosphatase C